MTDGRIRGSADDGKQENRLGRGEKNTEEKKVKEKQK